MSKMSSLYTRPEIWFIILVMGVPLGVAFILKSSRFSEFITQFAVAMIIGLCVWIGGIFLNCRRFDRKCGEDTKEP